MRACLKLKPGQRGTKKLVELYGSRLLCVRYWYDQEKRKRFKTVELVVEEVPWEPGMRERGNPVVSLCVDFAERDLQTRVKAAGGMWNSQECLWEIRYKKAITLGLGNRIVKQNASVQENRNGSGCR